MRSNAVVHLARSGEIDKRPLGLAPKRRRTKVVLNWRSVLKR
jgi:hypothetical protein